VLNSWYVEELTFCGGREEKMASQGKVGYLETKKDDAQRVNSSFFVVDVILRLLAMGCTFSAAIVMGTNKQMVMLPIVGPWPAKYQYSPAFVYVGRRILDQF